MIEPDSERDLITDMEQAPWFVEKLRANRAYAQNVYAALCNMRWQLVDVMPILRDQYWSCSWRMSGGIVASLRNSGEDYLDYYCSGIGGGFQYDDDIPADYVAEGVVTDEVRADLARLGWHASAWPDKESV
jgi:hypothetical protein